MAFRKRIYRATDAGLHALENPPAGISLPCMRILALLKGDTHYAVVRADMRMCEEGQIGNWLHDLESRGLVA